MLDIPDDSVSGLDVEASESPKSSDSLPVPVKKEYPKLQQWLMNEADLEFQFDKASYSNSVGYDNDVVEAQRAYVTLIYKIVADLAKKGLNTVIKAENEDYIGVVSATSRDMGASKELGYKHMLVNDAFSHICGEFNNFYERVTQNISEDNDLAYEDLHCILSCLEAHCFVPSERQRPELVMRWINEYDPKPENEYINSIMYNTPVPYKHLQFWTMYLGTLLLRGMFERAEESLNHSQYEELAETCPGLHAIIEDFITIISTYTSMALKGEFAKWKYTVCDFRDNFKSMRTGISDPQHVTIASNIHDLLGLMSGLPKTTASFVSTWYEMYGALSLFQVRDDPDVHQDYFELSLHEKGIDIDSPLDEAFRDIIQKKYLKVVLLIYDLDSATAAYVGKLFDLKGFFNTYYEDITDQIIAKLKKATRRYVSDYLLTIHAFECFEIHGLVPVAMGILLTPLISSEDEFQKKEIVEKFLPNYQCLTNDDLEWALTICTKLQLPGVVQSLLLKQSDKSLDDGHIYEALNSLVGCLAGKSGTEQSKLAMEKVHYIVWKLLFEDLLLNSSPVPDELLTNLITDQVDSDFPVNPVIRQCLSPVAVLTEFFLSLNNSEQDLKNVSRLFHLLKFKYLPAKYFPLLLAQFLPLLSHSSFEYQHYIIMIDLIDSYEIQQKLSQNKEEAEDLYKYAATTLPDKNDLDWRVQLNKTGQSIPQNIEDLTRELRERIMEKIGLVYMGA